MVDILTPEELFAILQEALSDEEFVRYNIPEKLGKQIRPLPSKDVKELRALSLLYQSEDKWSEKATARLLELSEKASERARELEKLLLDNGFCIRYSRPQKRAVVSSKSPLGDKILFTWQLPEYEEYDGGMLEKSNEEDFLASVMAGDYDSKYDKEYLSSIFKKRELREGVSPVGDLEYSHYFVERPKDADEEDDEDDTNPSDLTLI